MISNMFEKLYQNVAGVAVPALGGNHGLFVGILWLIFGVTIYAIVNTIKEGMQGGRTAKMGTIIITVIALFAFWYMMTSLQAGR